MITADSNGSGGGRTGSLDDIVVDCAVYERGARRPGHIRVSQALQTARRCGGFVWIGLREPSYAEFAEITATFELPPLAVEDAITAHQRPKLERHDGHLLQVVEMLESYDRLLSDVLSAELAQITVRQNQVAAQQNEDMRKISAWAAIALVPTAVAGIYGMNFDNMPELRTRYGYFVVLGVIAAICLLLYVLFRRNRWL